MEKLLVKNLKNFVKTQAVPYATNGNKRLFVSLHAGPNVHRYIVKTPYVERSFTKAGDAVAFFNDEEA